MESTRLINATCPDCRGPLTEITQSLSNTVLHEYRCLVGHTYSAKALLQAHSETQERALWFAVVALREATNLIQAVAPEFPPEIYERLMQQAETKRKQADDVRAVLERLEPLQTG